MHSNHILLYISVSIFIFGKDINPLQVGAKINLIALLAHVGRGLGLLAPTLGCANLDVYLY